MKKILLLEDLNKGTIITTIQSNGYEVKTKMLKSGTSNWESICKMLQEDNDKEILARAGVPPRVAHLSGFTRTQKT